MYACIYELRKNCCGRVDGWRIEGSTRGPRGPKKNSLIFLLRASSRYCCLPSLCPWNKVFCNLSVSFTVQEFSSYGIIIIICPDTPQITAWVGIIIWWAYNVNKSIFSSGIFPLQECRNNPLFIRKVFSITLARWSAFLNFPSLGKMIRNLGFHKKSTSMSWRWEIAKK